MLACVPMTTRAANEEALEPCSACSTKSVSSSLAASAEGFSPLSIQRKLAAWAEILVRGNGRLAVPDALVRGHDHRHLRRQPDALAQRRRPGNVAAFGIEGRQRRDGRAQHVHGVGRLDGGDDVQDRRRQPARGFQLPREALELRDRRQLAVQQEIGRLFEGGVLRQIVDRIAAVAQLAGFAVDESRCGPLEIDVFQAAVDLGCSLGAAHDSRLLDRGRRPCYEGAGIPDMARRKEVSSWTSSRTAWRRCTAAGLGWFYPRARTSASCVRQSGCAGWISPGRS